MKITWICVLLMSVVLLSCSRPNTAENFVCTLSTQDKQVCTSVLSLESGTLRLLKNNKRFELFAHYDACYQSRKVKITGIYQQQPHESVFDLELLAQKIEAKDEVIERFPRTIGLIALNNASLKGRFIDVWATIRTHTQTVENLPPVAVTCRKENNK